MITLFQCLYLVLFSFICYQGAAALSHSTAVSWLTAVLGAAAAGLYIWNTKRVWDCCSFQLCAWIAVIQVMSAGVVLIGTDIMPVLCVIAIFAGCEGLRIGQSALQARLSDQIDKLTQAEQHANQMLIDVRSRNHDTMKHITAIKSAQPKADTQAYIQNWADQYSQYDRFLKGENAYVAGVLYDFLEKARASNVSVSLHMHTPLSSLPFSPADQVSLVGNILENALDSAAEAREKAEIKLETSLRSGLYVLTCENSTPGMDPKVLDTIYQSFGRSTKNGAHEGMGTYIIQKLVKSAFGRLDFTYRHPVFRLEIKIPFQK
ncbi:MULTISPECIES: two-component system sensor histidine kinase NatK [Bacillus]|uniref:two-component system sensor histidine kinase NatK n=1 Tax=Bacillus TaxID=1386 RepID=UPI000B4CE2B3|nr:two-component system sensor histidine kinase NatK [Bacillus subtilis]ASC83313.1 ATP-binding protein [Bacillus subtilis]MBJ3805009.1 two-component system sensor histidine kinase NatK [Bacillus subtilis]MBR0022734.1 GHKL domain-containing protein [Bacillus subtilis]MCM3010580.1 two-component system sensor histidine kinase NatK [Bacillus subtilis]MDK8210028.1 two-component system sensor histidine kinase NatK [Bacillus subtilis]